MSDRPNLDILRRAIGDVPALTYCDTLPSSEPSPYQNAVAVEWREELEEIVLEIPPEIHRPKPKVVIKQPEPIEPIILLSRTNERILKRLLFGCGIGRDIKAQHPGNDYFERLEQWIESQRYYGKNWKAARPKMEGHLVPEALWLFFKDRYTRNGDGLLLSLKKLLQ